MKIWPVAIFFLWVWSSAWAEFRIWGENGWIGEFSVEEPARKKKPFVLFVYSGPSTNTELFLDDRPRYRFRLDLPDGQYGFSLLDGDRKLVTNGRFVLKTPFRIQIRKIDPRSAEVGISTAVFHLLGIRLEEKGRTVLKRALHVTNPRSVFLEDLEPSRDYVLTAEMDNYRTVHPFRTSSENAALGKPVFGTFRRFPESKFVDDSTPAITRVNDGVWGWYRGMAVSGELKSEDQFVYINLERDRKLRSFTVVWHAMAYPRLYYLVVGSDGKRWKKIPREAVRFVNRTAPDNSPVKVDTLETNLTARYVGVIVPKGKGVLGKGSFRNTLSLLEVEAYE